MKQREDRLVERLVWGGLLSISCLLVFSVLAQGIVKQTVFRFDNLIYQALRSFSPHRLDGVASLFTELGSYHIQMMEFVAVALIFLWARRLWEPAVLFICFHGAWGINLALKALFHRDRPWLEPYLVVSGYSFPSGHAMSSIVFYGMGAYLLWQMQRRKMKGAWLIQAASALLILEIGLSRIYLGVHYASDVLAGFAAGGLWLMLCLAGESRLRRLLPSTSQPM